MKLGKTAFLGAGRIKNIADGPTNPNLYKSCPVAPSMTIFRKLIVRPECGYSINRKLTQKSKLPKQNLRLPSSVALTVISNIVFGLVSKYTIC